MATVADVLQALDRIAPTEFALPGDKVGLQLGRRDREVTSAVVALDHSDEAVTKLLTSGAQLLVCHHPLIWQPLDRLTGATDVQRVAEMLVRADASFIGAHTNWDCAAGGVNDTLADELGLLDVTPFGPRATFEVLKLVTFVPESAVEAVLEAAGSAGAGRIGDYSSCAFTHSGDGRFDAPKSGKPAVGRAGERNRVPEVRIEMELPRFARQWVEAEVRRVHPYEEPAIDFLVSERQGMPIARCGNLPRPMGAGELQAYLDDRLHTRTMAWQGSEDSIECVSVIGGGADDEWAIALDRGCHAFITGEVRQHNAVAATAAGISIFSAGHYATEQPGVVALRSALSKALPTIDWILFEPRPGTGGRPL